MKQDIELNADAIKLRKIFGQDAYSPIDIFSIITSIENLTLVFFPFSNRISGMCIRDDLFKIIAINSLLTYGRQRYTAAHELYHIYYHSHFENIVCAQDIEKPKDEKEVEADKFASYFLAPFESLQSFIKEKLQKDKGELDINDVVKVEQHFGISRRAILWRLTNENYLNREEADKMKVDIIRSALKLGYDDKLYTPSNETKRYFTMGKYIEVAEGLKDMDKISYGMYEELLLDAYRSDIVFGLDLEGEESYD